MGITDTSSRYTEVGDGVNTTFNFNFRVFDETDLVVIVVTTLTGVEVVKTLTTHYTVALNAGEGGVVTIPVAPLSTETVYIGKAVPETQPNAITVGNLPASTLEQMYDRLTMLIHQVVELTARSPKLRRSTATPNATIEDFVEDYYLRWDASGNIVSSVAVLPAGGITDGDISASAAIALAKLEALTANRAVVSDGSGEVVASTTTDTEIGYVNGVTSAIQTQIDAKASSSDLTTHAALTTSHGVTGDIVGTGGAQTLLTKTLDLPAITTGAILTNQAYLNFRESGGVNYIGFKAPAALAGNVDFILPTGDGSAGEVLQTDGAANLSWDAALLASTATTKGDIYAATASATITRLGVGTNGQVLTAASGQATGMEWATPSASTANLTVYSETTTYTVLVTDDLILCDTSGGAFTITLPTAVGNTGKQFKIKYTDSGFANALTVDGDGTETIDGSTTTTLNTEGETLTIVSDGTNWEIVDRHIPGIITTYTPTFTGFGTAASIQATWTRERAYALINGRFTTGTPTAVEARISLPGSKTVDSSLADETIVGQFLSGWTGNAAPNHFIGLSGDAYVTFGREESALDWASNQNGNSITSTGTNNTFWFKVPITGWNG